MLRRATWKFVFVFVAALIAYLGYAAFSLNRTFVALASGDAANVQKYADLDSIRATLKTQIDAEIARGAAGLKRNNSDLGQTIGANLLSALGSGLANSAIDSIVTPRGLADLLAGRKGPTQRADEGRFYAIWKRTHFDSPDRVRFSPGNGMELAFHFDGVTWTLIDIHVPFDDFLEKLKARPKDVRH